VVGDGNTVGVAWQIVQDVFRAAKWRLGVDYSVLLEQLAQEFRECSRFGQQQVLSPRVKNAEESDLGAEVSVVSCHLEQSLCAGAQQ
jgi:hypothetical protein